MPHWWSRPPPAPPVPPPQMECGAVDAAAICGLAVLAAILSWRSDGARSSFSSQHRPAAPCVLQPRDASSAHDYPSTPVSVFALIPQACGCGGVCPFAGRHWGVVVLHDGRRRKRGRGRGQCARAPLVDCRVCVPVHLLCGYVRGARQGVRTRSRERLDGHDCPLRLMRAGGPCGGPVAEPGPHSRCACSCCRRRGRWAGRLCSMVIVP